MSPETQEYVYDAERWNAAMEWLERRASIDLLRHLKSMEPPLTDPAHDGWQNHYDKFKERVLGFIKARATGIVDDPETVYFVLSLLSRIQDFSGRALKFLRVEQKESLGMAERPAETDVVLREVE